MRSIGRPASRRGNERRQRRMPLVGGPPCALVNRDVYWPRFPQEYHSHVPLTANTIRADFFLHGGDARASTAALRTPIKEGAAAGVVGTPPGPPLHHPSLGAVAGSPSLYLDPAGKRYGLFHAWGWLKKEFTERMRTAGGEGGVDGSEEEMVAARAAWAQSTQLEASRRWWAQPTLPR